MVDIFEPVFVRNVSSSYLKLSSFSPESSSAFGENDFFVLWSPFRFLLLGYGSVTRSGYFEVGVGVASLSRLHGV